MEAYQGRTFTDGDLELELHPEDVSKKVVGTVPYTVYHFTYRDTVRVSVSQPSRWRATHIAALEACAYIRQHREKIDRAAADHENIEPLEELGCFSETPFFYSIDDY